MNVFYQGMYMYLFRLRFLGFVARSKLLRTPNPTPADIPVMVAAFPAATSAGIAAAKGMIPLFVFVWFFFFSYSLYFFYVLSSPS